MRAEKAGQIAPVTRRTAAHSYFESIRSENCLNQHHISMSI